MATIDAHYFRVCTLGAERAGHNRAALLATANLVEADISRPGWRGSVEAMTILVRAIWAALDDEHMGCTDTPVRPGAFALMTELALTQPTVQAALAKGMAFYALLTEAITTRLDIKGDHAVITVRFRQPELDAEHYFSQFWLIIWHRFACWLAGETVPLLRAEFPYARPIGYFEEFKYLFPGKLRFGASEHRLVLERASLAGPVRRGESERAAMVARAPLDFMTIPASDHSVSRQVRQLLRPRDAAGGFIKPSLDTMAAALGLTPVTLARRLREEGTSLSQLAENQRRDMAIRRLAEGRSTVETIAAELGYAEARSFTRAFRAWTGQSPLRYRRGQRD
ncbi:AraC family transcriptional regulator ligand-binding domain-containing protein [Parapedomonas caeni]